MKTYSLTLDDDQVDSLEIAATAIGLSPEQFLKRALARAIAETEPEYNGPIQAIRTSPAYGDAKPPFSILQSLGSTNGAGICDFDPPLPLSRSNLLRLQEQGITMVNLRFQDRYREVREPDFSIKMLLQLPSVV